MAISNIATRNLKGTNFLTNIYNYKLNSIMHRPVKTNKTNQNNIDIEQNSQELDLRLQRQIKLASKLQNELSQRKQQLQFCEQYLDKLKEQHEIVKQHALLGKSNHFGGWQTRLKQLTIQSLEHEGGSFQNKTSQNSKKHTKIAVCSQKKHLQEILDEKVRKSEQDQIEKLEQKLKGLYSKIQKVVIQEFMNEKIMNKIRRQSRKAAKLKTVQFIDKQISKYKNWVDQNTQKINNERTAKEIQEKIVFNLQLMKLLMSKKIINNDYIYQQFVIKQIQNRKNIQNSQTIAQRIQQNYQNIAKNFKKQNSSSQSQLQNASFLHKQDKSAENFHIEAVTDYLNYVENTLFNLQKYDFKKKVQAKCLNLQIRLDELIGSFKK